MQADRSYMKNTLVLADLTYEKISPPPGTFQWKGFLSAQVSPYELSKTMAQVFVQGSFPVRKNLVQRAMNRDGLDLLRSVFGLSY